MKPEVVFRVDAGEGIGLGHLRRCLALAQALKREGAEITLATQRPREISGFVKGRYPVVTIPKQGLGREPAWFQKKWKHRAPGLLITDRYELTPAYFKALRRFIPAVVMIDDEARLASFPVDGIINYNVHALTLPYQKAHARLWLGPRYALIHDDFLKWRRKKTSAKACRKLLVSLGGFAPQKASDKVECALHFLRQSRRLDLVRLAGKKGSVAGLMAAADMALSAGGVTSYELACLGIPSVLVIRARNQEPIARKFAAYGAAVNAGWLDRLSAARLSSEIEKLMADGKKRARLARKARFLVDGKGAQRLARELMTTYFRRKK
ncbi:MAG TPA: hypothetical protein VL688_01340 [Verrucomicrobiae bacterium]|nr:hypothetical protein [Verrucomicrobiae bacterium]